jgi:hypothetical protein
LNKTLPVTLPDWMWGRLATIAEHRNTLAADLVAVAIVGLLKDDQHRLAELDMELNAARAGGYRTEKVRATAKGNKK